MANIEYMNHDCTVINISVKQNEESYLVKFIESCSWFLKQQQLQLFCYDNNVFADQ